MVVCYSTLKQSVIVYYCSLRMYTKVVGGYTIVVGYSIL